MSNRIKSFLAISALALAIPMSTQANTGGDPSLAYNTEEANPCAGMKHGGHHKYGKDGQHHAKRGERMFDKLGLTPDQRVKAREVMDKHHEKMKAERMAMMQEMDSLLTPEQREKAKALRPKRTEN